MARKETWGHGDDRANKDVKSKGDVKAGFDVPEKILMGHADVFADCMNVLAYKGRRKLCAEDLCPAPTESFYRGPDRVRSQFCDVSFFLLAGGRIRLQYIIENQTRLRRRLVLRKASYQGGVYRGQLESKGKAYPVIGMVLDWTGKSTGIPHSLHRLMAQDGASGEDLALVDEVSLMVWHMRNLPKEVRSLFVSDMGFVVDYLGEGSFASRQGQRIVHVEALCEMMEAITKDTRFTDMVGELLERQKEGREIIMCEYIDMLEARGEARGEVRGKKIGKRIGKKIGKKVGKEIGENQLARLISKLIREKKYQEIEEASNDRKRRQELYRQYGIL